MAEALYDKEPETTAVVRKHITTFNSFVRTSQYDLLKTGHKDRVLLQPHYNSMRGVPAVNRGRSGPHMAICSHFLQKAYIKPQFAPTREKRPRPRMNVGCWTGDGRHLVCGTEQGDFAVWESENFKFVKWLPRDHLWAGRSAVPIKALEWSNYGQIVVAGAGSAEHPGLIKYFDSSLFCLGTIEEAHHSSINSISFSPSDSKYVSCGDDTFVKIWDGDRFSPTPERVLTEHLSEVTQAQWHPQRALVMSVSKDMTCKMWDPRHEKSVATVYAHKKHIVSCGWSCGGNLFATGSKDSTVKIFDIRALGRTVSTFRGHSSEVRVMQWHPQHDNLLLSGDYNGQLAYWVVGESSSAHTRIENAHRNSLNMICYHPIGHIVSTASFDGSVKFWCREPPGSKNQVETIVQMTATGPIEETINIIWGPEPAVETGPEESVTVATGLDAEEEVAAREAQEKLVMEEQKPKRPYKSKEQREMERDEADDKLASDFSAVTALLAAKRRAREVGTTASTGQTMPMGSAPSGGSLAAIANLAKALSAPAGSLSNLPPDKRLRR